MARRTARVLDRATVLREAFALLDEAGLAGLNMRALARRLNVQAPAFYWHFSSKAELLSQMSAAIYREARMSAPSSEDWASWLLGYGRALRSRLSSLRDAAQVCAIAKPQEATGSISASTIAEPLTELGLGQADALDAIAAVTSLCLGWSSYETEGDMLRFLEDIMDFDNSFENALEALVEGLKLRLSHTGQAASQSA